MSTSSTERTGDKRWNVSDPSLTTNPDLARLVRLQAHLVATTGLQAGTPLVGIGMSNGARFVTLWGQALQERRVSGEGDLGQPRQHGPAVRRSASSTVPTVFSTSENDFTVPPGQVIPSFGRAQHPARRPSSTCRGSAS